MTNARIERSMNAFNAFVKATFDTYIDRANLGTTGKQAPHITNSVVTESMPDTTPRPFVMMNLIQGFDEAYQPQYHKQTFSVFVGVLIGEIDSANCNIVQMRFIDAFIDMLAENPTIAGAVVEAKLVDFDKYSFPAEGNGAVSFTVEILVESSTP